MATNAQPAPGLGTAAEGGRRNRERLIPPGHTPGSRFLPWIIGLMGYLGCLALAAVVALAGLSARWQSDFDAGLLVELDPIAGIEADDDGRLQATLNALNQVAGIETVTALPPDRQLESLRPWIDDPSLLSELPLPTLIEVTLSDGGQAFDPAALEAVLGADIAGLRVIDQAPLATDLLRPARIAEAFAYAILLAVFAASLLLSAFSARAALASHMRLVSLLHLIGATDRDIAKEIEWHILRRGGVGAVAGLIAALISLVLAVTSTGGAGWPSFLPRMTLDPFVVLAMVLFPALLVVLAVLTARFTVIRELARHA
ncbi:MAG: hypothetical protein KI792_03190 [Alphaproteobacteria bacterium]|nr:hypothetical protein [Alphaproteobacteria bacterium SS10]